MIFTNQELCSIVLEALLRKGLVKAGVYYQMLTITDTNGNVTGFEFKQPEKAPVLELVKK